MAGVSERVLAAADQLFYERGIQAVGVNELAKTANVTKAAMYARFATKDDIVVAYLRGRIDAAMGLWRDALAQAGPEPAERIDAIFAGLMMVVESSGYRGCPFANAISEFGDPTHKVWEPVREYRDWLRSGLFGPIVRDAGVDDEGRVVEQLHLLYDAALHSAVVEQTSLPVERARELARLAMNDLVRA
jgi:AcrR family transcriptional regulator